MTTPRVAILNEIEARLNTISIANGYFKDITKIKRGIAPLNADEEYPALYYFPLKSSMDSTDQSGIEFQKFSVVFQYVDSYGDDGNKEPYEIVDTMAASIETCLFRKTTDPHVDTGKYEPTLNNGCPLLSTATDNNGMQTEDTEYFIHQQQRPLIVAQLIIAFAYRVNRNNKFIRR